METMKQIQENAEILQNSIEQQKQINSDNRERKTLYLIILLSGMLNIIFIFIFWTALNKDTNIVNKPIVKDITTHLFFKPKIDIINADNISTEDLKILNSLIPILKKREGLRLKPYTLSRKLYIGYGHKILKGERLTTIDSIQAEVILIQDIRKAFFEVQRIERKELKNKVLNVFIKGKL